jgi:hypothetical protein
VNPLWLSAFLDFSADVHEAGSAFWSEVTGYAVSPTRGEHDEFTTLVPPDGDDYLRIQRTGANGPSVHIDVHATQVPDGATVLADHGDYLTCTSPGGMVFCLVGHPRAQVPSPRQRDGRRTRLDQVCLDVPPSRYADELAFWERLTGWVRRDPPAGSPFGRLTPPYASALQLLVQRLDDEQPAVTAHLDWATTDREAEVAAHEAAGATRGPAYDWWTVMTDPAGLIYCVTRREP